MENTATEIGTIKKELEFMPISNPSSSKNTNKVYHKKVKKYKILSQIKNIAISLLFLWLMWNNHWIIEDTMVKNIVGSATFVGIVLYVLNSIDRWIVSIKAGDTYGI